MTKDPQHGMLSLPKKEDVDLLKPALELFANGTYVRKIDACDFLIKNGFWKRKYASAYIDKFTEILKDPFYMGDIYFPKWGVTRRKGHHQGIISAETFDLIQKRLDKNGITKTIRKDTTEDFPLRGLLSCSGCGHSITAAWTRSRQKLFPYYFCQNGDCEFGKKSIRKKTIEDEFGLLLRKTKLRREVGNVVQKVFDSVWEEEISVMKKEEGSLDRKKSDLKNKAKDLTDMILSAKNDKVKSAYENRLEEVMQELESASEVVPLKQIDLTIPYRNALDISVGLVENPYPIWEKMSVVGKHQLFFFIFDEKLRYSKKEGYRNNNLPYAVRLFEEFATTNPRDVEKGGVEPPCK